MSNRSLSDTAADREVSKEPLVALGRALRETRQKRGEDLYDIAEYLKIRPSYLFAIEDGDFEATPGLTYAIGFLKSYAHYLGYDAHEIALQVKRALDGKRDEPELQYRKPAADNRRPSAMFVVASVALPLIAYGGWQLSQRSDLALMTRLTQLAGDIGRYASEWTGLNDGKPSFDANGSEGGSDVETANRSLPPTTVPEDTLAALQLEAPEPPAPTYAGRIGGDARIVLVAREKSWIQIKSDARDFVRTRTLMAGDRIAVPDRDDLALWTGNAGAVEILLDGKSVGVLGEAGAFAEAVPLLAESLRGRIR